MRAMLNGLPCGTLALDRGGAVVDASARAAALLNMAMPRGADFAQMFGVRFDLAEVVRPEDLERGVDVRVDESTLWVQSAPPLADDAVYRVVTVTDITPFS